MDEATHKRLKEKWQEGRIGHYTRVFEGSRESALEFLIGDDQREAARRGMSPDDYREYAFQRHCVKKLYEHRCARMAAARKLESENHIEEAVYMYEALLNEGFASSHFTIGLAKIYRKQKRLDEEIRVLERGLDNLEHYKDGECEYDQSLYSVEGNIIAVQERLDKARIWKAKADKKK